MIVKVKSLPAGGLIFSRQLSEVSGGRLDPIANQEKRRKFEQAIRSSSHPVYPLRKVVGMGKNIVNEIAEGESYIGLENIDGESGEFIGTTDKESISSAVQFAPGQILFPKLRPYLNKTHLATFSGICSTEFHVFTPQGINGEFLTVLLRSRSIVGITSLLMTGNTLPRLQISDIEQLPVPVPPYPIQEKAVNVWRKALNQRVRRLADAQALIQGIDDVLLEELGIPRKPEPPNTLESRIFRRDFSTVSGKRIDPAANWKRLSLDGGKFPLRRLRDVASINPVTRFPKLEPGTLVSFVPMDAVSDVFGEIADRQTRPIEEAGSYTPFLNGDVIVAKITPCMENGKAAVADGLVEGVGYGSTEFHVFRRRSLELFPQYLHHLLRLKTVREHARRNFTGSSGHQRVDEDFFCRMEIPFPPMKVQERIAEKAEATKTEARKLFADARADLEKAKRDIEALILGKEVAE
jgi:hypothetical protein